MKPSPLLMVEEEKTESPKCLSTAKDSPISPGTTSLAGISTKLPSLITMAEWARVFFNSSTMEPAWYSWKKPTAALRNNKPRMTPKSTQSSKPAAKTAAASMTN
ncbi:hypothetical protein WICPIJ_006805 [Wickerhamomyces pijperi]|uniref:Uncharacterized protein n=1 Tax=Wickerhamomyces pijperi TaxID=599730 RepID=A0A9P8Q1C9_WICPI|nr:hypothetical protein WICPIJ_006805 [Wickerhamomyces pijperi]